MKSTTKKIDFKKFQMVILLKSMDPIMILSHWVYDNEMNGSPHSMVATATREHGGEKVQEVKSQAALRAALRPVSVLRDLHF
eukprot:5054462-Pleurochrysis_carterae.AAC.1